MSDFNPRIVSACLRIASGISLLIAIARLSWGYAMVNMIDIWIYVFLAFANFAWAEYELRNKE